MSQLTLKLSNQNDNEECTKQLVQYDPMHDNSLCALDAPNHRVAIWSFLGAEETRRIAACVNACVGISTKMLDSAPGTLAEGFDVAAVLLDQHNQLLAAAEKVLAGLERRIAESTNEAPVFDGIADLHEAVNIAREF